MKTTLETTNYDNLVIIDSQVVLEAKPLEQLPWKELFEGSILLLVVRQVQTEIDAKKGDGRLGKRARGFNKQLDGFIESRLPSSVTTDPTVDVATLQNKAIDWDCLESLDRNNGDDLIVAQSLNALIDRPDDLVLLSHDMRPRDAAATHGLKAVKLPETWLKEPEPSPHERRLKELEQKIRLLEADQPQLKLHIEAISAEPWKYREVTPPSSDQVNEMLLKLIAEAPRQPQRSRWDVGLDYDHSFGDRLKNWEKNLREDLPQIHKGLTKLYAQHRIRVKIENVGSVSAEGLSLEIRSGNSVLHSKPYWVLVSGPAAPHPRPFHLHTSTFLTTDFQPLRREQFKFYWDVSGPGGHIIQSCKSFRQDKTHIVEVFVELLADTPPKLHVEAVATASNMKGDERKRKLIEVPTSAVPFNDVFDAQERCLKVRPDVDISKDWEPEDYTFLRNNGTEREVD
jgi:hypothetical protein